MVARGNNAKKKDKRRRHAKTRKLARENVPVRDQASTRHVSQGLSRAR